MEAQSGAHNFAIENISTSPIEHWLTKKNWSQIIGEWIQTPFPWPIDLKTNVCASLTWEVTTDKIE